ncbi:hypothetical protein M2317_002924 [Microbacterium sp. ZKA21]|uniref:hypothetical protein n=1 Tax=Microbacterium sp. ZKA21 TaxID=3381694 RepID=UPI003D20ED5E
MASFTVGLDLGQGLDYSALTIVERVMVLPPRVSIGTFYRQPAEVGAAMREELHVRHLRRWELGTPYPSIVADVTTLMRTPQMREGGMLFVDSTGVGRAVMDMFYGAYREERFGCYPPAPVTITAGRERNGWNVPKMDLLAAVQAPLQLGTLKIAGDMALGPTLEKELTSFRQTISQSGRESYDVQRRAGEGHGDLVIALALALFQKNTVRRPDVVENNDSLGKETPWMQ